MLHGCVREGRQESLPQLQTRHQGDNPESGAACPGPQSTSVVQPGLNPGVGAPPAFPLSAHSLGTPALLATAIPAPALTVSVPTPSPHLSSWKQWAAVITQRSVMRAPPQMCRPRTWRLACHGHSPSEDTAPPTMRPEGPCRPQSGGGRGGPGETEAEKGEGEGKARKTCRERMKEGQEGHRQAGPRGGAEAGQRDRCTHCELSLQPPGVGTCLPPPHALGPSAGRGSPAHPPCPSRGSLAARAGSPQCCSSEPSLQSGCPSQRGLGFFTQLRSSHWKVNVPHGTPGREGVGQGTEGGPLSPRNPPNQGPGETKAGRGQEATGEGSLGHNGGSPRPPSVSQAMSHRPPR